MTVIKKGKFFDYFKGSREIYKFIIRAAFEQENFQACIGRNLSKENIEKYMPNYKFDFSSGIDTVKIEYSKDKLDVAFLKYFQKGGGYSTKLDFKIDLKTLDVEVSLS